MPNRARILCVEDETDFRENIVEFLQHESFEVIEARNGREGLEQFAKSRPDIVLCDIQMPEMNGLDMLGQLREQYPDTIHDTNFLFLSALDDKQTVISGYHLGCDDYISKPVDYDLLLAKLDRKLKSTNYFKQNIDSPRAVLDKALPKMWRQELQRPIDILLGYTGLLSDDQHSSAIANYLDHLESFLKEQSNQIQLVSRLYEACNHQYQYDPKPVKLEHFVWEAYVTALGYEKAPELNADKTNVIAKVDSNVTAQFLDRFIRESFRATHKVCRHYILPADEQTTELVLSSNENANPAHMAWQPASIYLQNQIARGQTPYYALSLCFAVALEIMQPDLVSVSATSDSHLSIKLRMDAVDVDGR